MNTRNNNNKKASTSASIKMSTRSTTTTTSTTLTPSTSIITSTTLAPSTSITTSITPRTTTPTSARSYLGTDDKQSCIADTIQPLMSSLSSLDKYQNLIDNIAKDFTDKLERIKCSFHKQITELHEIISQLVNNFNYSVSHDHAIKLDKRLDAIERHIHSNDIVIDGIPSGVENFNPVAAFKTLCHSVKYEVPDYQYITHLRARKSSSAGSIIVRLLSNDDKTKFLKCIHSFAKLNVNKLTLREIGLDSNVRVFVHESLTKCNYHIFREALKSIKRNKSLNHASVFSRNGRVFVKISKDESPVYISSSDDLAGIIKQTLNDNNNSNST